MFMHVGTELALDLHRRRRAQHVQAERAAAQALAIEAMTGVQRGQRFAVEFDFELPATALTGVAHGVTPYNDRR